MLLAFKTKGFFVDEVRRKGDLYYKQGSVNQEQLNETAFSAVVMGTRAYKVELKWLGNSLQKLNLTASCTCPHFETKNLCKHVWASILHASHTDFGKGAFNFDTLVLDGSTEGSPSPEITRDESSLGGKGKKNWQRLLGNVEVNHQLNEQSIFHPDRQRLAHYIFSAPEKFSKQGVRISFYVREEVKDGKLGAVKPLRLKNEDIPMFQDSLDQKILRILNDLKAYESAEDREVVIPPSILPIIIPLILETKRASFNRANESHLNTLKPEAETYELDYQIAPTDEKNQYALTAHLESKTGAIELSKIAFAVPEAGVFFTSSSVGHFEPNGPASLLESLIENGPLKCDENDLPQLIGRVLKLSFRKTPALSKDLGWKVTRATCKPVLRLKYSPMSQAPTNEAEVLFRYGKTIYSTRNLPTTEVDYGNKSIFVRDIQSEHKYLDRLRASAQNVRSVAGTLEVNIRPAELSVAMSELSTHGWDIEVEKSKVVKATDFKFDLKSNMDWFDLTSKVTFGGQSFSLPEVLKSIESTGGWVKLKTDEFGFIPDEIVKKFLLLKSIGEANGAGLRFRKQQALLLSALFEENRAVITDQHFKDVVKNLEEFESIKTVPVPKNFNGKLRNYQKDGLSWLNFLYDFSFGGCLADDMGLGKTVQVLAFLQHLKVNVKLKTKTPHLIVVPKTLIYNWQAEAKRFVPHFKVAAYAGPTRKDLIKDFAKLDVVLVTYHTLRIDLEEFLKFNFNLVVLDEAQAIKNPQSQVAKAVKLLNCQNRLVLTGTPIENHFGDLLSIFQFLNPGLFANKALTATNLNVLDDSMKVILQGIRPFLLRRTKDEVLKELPPKTEQVLFCEMGEEEKREYDDLKEYYKNKLSDSIKESGIDKSKIFVLEALLRLRQLASHPGLIDKEQVHESSAKLEVLFEHVHEIIESGHKLLIFSQFTSLLSIVAEKVKGFNYQFAYLDGKTQNRQEVVERFQNDPECKIFLVSLKAGGVGLNLTAADYCFLLDPWWNPAVEAQAIDRIHRIGQKNKVVAYRLITKGTVEEKVLELQTQKKALSKALMASDQSFLKQMKAEDLKWILE